MQHYLSEVITIDHPDSYHIYTFTPNQMLCHIHTVFTDVDNDTSEKSEQLVEWNDTTVPEICK